MPTQFQTQVTEAHKALIREILAHKLDPDGPPFIEQSAALVAASERDAVRPANARAEIAEAALAMAKAHIVKLRETLRALDMSFGRCQPAEVLARIDDALAQTDANFAGAVVLNSEQARRIKELASFTTSQDWAEVLAMLEGKAVASC